MKLREWVTANKGDRTRRECLADVAKAANVSLMTLLNVDRNAIMGQYSKAKAVSEATGGDVTIKELCE